ncbi:translocon-associated protein subunit delta isoform X2 [Panulirus ornatus]|uniref:translocon-associated protein subunit delta isoform X2 n=1 Tax=Panulirus ornatus TaxID=150431 RepID=UPI003A88F3AF
MKVIPLLLAAFIGAVAGETCSGAQVDAVGFTSLDATIVTKIAYIADFTLSCSNGAKDVSLYAETIDGIVGIARSVDGVKYQAQRGNEDTSSVLPIATINLYHPGAYRGPWVQSETMAILAAIFIYYYALTQKNKLMA